MRRTSTVGPDDGSCSQGRPVMTAEPDQLERRVAALEDQAAIVDVLYRYGHAIDFGDQEMFADCFTEDAVWEAHNAVNGSVMRNAGRDELRRFVEGHTRPPELFHKHVIAEARVQVDGDAATAACYFILLLGAPGGVPEVMTFGRYVDTLRREPDG